MLDYNLQLKGAPILSLHAGHAIGNLGQPIIIPTMLQIAGFFVESKHLDKHTTFILQANAIRELSRQGVVINSIDDISPSDDLIRLQEVLEINFNPIGCRVQTKSGTRLGQVSDFVLDGFLMIRQIIVKPPTLKSLTAKPLYIPRTAILEIKGNTIIIPDTATKTARTKLPAKFDPNFVNPFAKNVKTRESARSEV